MAQLAQQTLQKLRNGELKGCTRLDLSAGLSTLPPEVFALADSLEILNLTGNALNTLPDELANFSKLKVIFCSENQFDHVPEVLGRCKNLSMVGFKSNKIHTLSAKALPKKLQWLILTDNQLTHLPAEIGQCAELQKLMLAGNQLSDLPTALAECKKLELLRISANQFNALPTWLLHMPQLAWLAFAGNPLTSAIEADRASQHEALAIDWQALEIEQILGQGASGLIYQAKLTLAGQIKSVAVKVFKGDVTSDGLPKSEMAACLYAGLHPSLTQILGVISNHPENKQGLVLSLIEPSFSGLAHPPSLSSCTRDVYAENSAFSHQQVLSLALNIAHAMQHLHEKGITHGDLYAHNILHNGLGSALLSDFGAATFIPQPQHAEALQRIEVRAFACLLEELIERCQPDHVLPSNALYQLQQACAQPNTLQRPSFKQIVQTLEAL